MKPRFQVLALRGVRVMISAHNPRRWPRKARLVRGLRAKKEYLHIPGTALAELCATSNVAETQHRGHTQEAIERSVTLTSAQRTVGVRR